MNNPFSVKKSKDELNSFFIIATRKSVVALFDALIVNLTFILTSVIMVYPQPLERAVIDSLIGRSLYTTAIFIGIYFFFGLYNSLWEYAGLHEMVRCAAAGGIATLICLAADTICSRLALLNVTVLSLSVYFTSMLLIIALSGAIRLIYRMLRRTKKAH